MRWYNVGGRAGELGRDRENDNGWLGWPGGGVDWPGLIGQYPTREETAARTMRERLGLCAPPRGTGATGDLHERPVANQVGRGAGALALDLGG